jgi:hypothetical protein
MKRDLIHRNLRMGCGEGLVGRVRRLPADRMPVPLVRRTATVGPQAGKGKR